MSKLAAAGAVILVFCGMRLSAATCTFVPTDAAPDWNSSVNWVGGEMPSQGDSIVISNDFDGAVVDMPAMSVENLTVKGGQTVHIRGGKITLSGNFDCLRYVTVDNDLEFTRSTRLQFGTRTSANAEAAGGTSVFNGTITLTGALDWNLGGISPAEFYGAISGADASIWQPNLTFAPGSMKFYAPVKVKAIRYGFYAQNVYSFWVPGSEWGFIDLEYCNADFQCVNACATNAVLSWSGYYTSANLGNYRFNGYSQIADRIQSDSRTDGYRGDTIWMLDNRNNSSATLLLRGTAGATNYCKSAGPLSIIWAPTDMSYEQAFMGRAHETTGKLVVSNGTFRVGDSCSFKSVPEVCIEGGRFLVDSTVDEALGTVSTIGVAAGATLEVAPGATPFDSDRVRLALAESSCVSLAEGASLSVHGLTVGGFRVPAGTYTGEGGPSGLTVLQQISGSGTLTTANAAPSTGNTRTWKGGSGNFSESANWEEGEAPVLGDKVVLCASADGAQIVNDMQSVTLDTLTFQGSHGLTLSGNALACESMVNTITAGPVTNACPVNIARGAVTVSDCSVDGACLVYAGGVTGEGRLALQGYGKKGRHVFCAASSHTGGTTLLSGRTVLEHVNGLGAAGARISAEGASAICFCVDGGSFNYDCDFDANVDVYVTEDATIGGTIDSSAAISLNFYLCGESWTAYSNGGKSPVVHLTAPVSASLANSVVQGDRNSQLHFDAPVTIASLMQQTSSITWGETTLYFNATGGDIGYLRLCFGRSHATATNALGSNCRVDFAGYSPEANWGCLNLNGKNQCVNRLAASDGFSSCGDLSRRIVTDTSATLTLKPTDSNTTVARFDGPLSLVLDAIDADSVQSLTNKPTRENTMSGSMIVSNGTLRVLAGSSFPNVPRLEAHGTGVLEIRSDVEGAFAGVRTIDLTDGGTLVFSAETASPLAAYAGLTLVLDDTSSLTLPAGEKIVVHELYLNGDRLAEERDYGDGGQALGPIKGGTISVVVPEPAESTVATWDAGGGASTSFGVAANWAGDGLPAFLDRSVVATFASSGTVSTVDRLARFKGIRLFAPESPDGGATNVFAIRQSAGGDLRVGSEGLATIQRENDATCHAFTLDAPLTLEGPQTWDLLSTNDSLDVLRPIGSTYSSDLTIQGWGTYNLHAENDFAGDVTVRRGWLHLYGPTNNLGAGTGKVTILNNPDTELGSSYGAHVIFHGTTEEKPVTVRQASYLYGDNGTRVVFKGENTFNGEFKTDGSDGGFSVSENAKLVLNGGASFGYTTVFGGAGGEIFVNDRPMSCDHLMLQAPVTLHLNAASNTVENYLRFENKGASIAFGADYAIDDENFRFRTSIVNGWTGTVDFQGHSQRFGSWGGLHPNSTGAFTSALPATCELVCSQGETNAPVRVEGLLSIAKSGDGCLGVPNAWSSYGWLDVSAGTLDFLPEGSFANGSNVAVRATGRIRVAANRTFGRQATVRISGDGKMELADGTRNSVAALYVGGSRQPGGTYGSPQSGATHKLQCFEGGGLLRVSGDGCILVVR